MSTLRALPMPLAIGKCDVRVGLRSRPSGRSPTQRTSSLVTPCADSLHDAAFLPPHITVRPRLASCAAEFGGQVICASVGIARADHRPIGLLRALPAPAQMGAMPPVAMTPAAISPWGYGGAGSSCFPNSRSHGIGILVPSAACTRRSSDDKNRPGS